jgi:hypothetical protein
MHEEAVLTRKELTRLHFSASHTKQLIPELVHLSCVGRWQVNVAVDFVLLLRVQKTLP